MLCPRCGQRRAKRACPALGITICSVCCGTQRLTEITCPATCEFLRGARVHPPAAILRQQEQDATTLLPWLSGLTERQHQLFFMLHAFIARFEPSRDQPLQDAELADAVGSVAGTFEMLARGLVPSQTPEDPVARQLSTELLELFRELESEQGNGVHLEAIPVLRRVEAAARQTGSRTRSDSPTAYLDIATRLLRQVGADVSPAAP